MLSVAITLNMNGDKDKTLSFVEYLDMIRHYLSDTKNDHKTQGKWKIQLTMAINFTAQKMRFSIKHFLSKCDLVTFNEEIPNGKLHFLCSALFLVKNVIKLYCASKM